MDADDCARIIEGVAAVLDLLAADGDAVDDPAPIYELLAERCRHVRVALEVMTGCEQPACPIAAGVLRAGACPTSQCAPIRYLPAPAGAHRGGAGPGRLCPPRAFPLAFHRCPVGVPGVASRHEKGRHRVPVAASRPATLANARSTPSCPRDVRSRRSRAPRHTQRRPSSGTPCRCARCGAQSRPAGR